MLERHTGDPWTVRRVDLGRAAVIRRRIARSLVLGISTALLVTSAARADTCCANTVVTLEPERAVPGETVSLRGIRCLNADNSGPLDLNLRAFWLSSASVPTDPDPASIPGSGVGIPADVPPVERWLPFARAGEAGGDTASLVVPDLPRGSYQLWWLCDNGGGPGSGIHYSGGARLAVGPRTPDTSTDETGSARSVGHHPLPLVLLAAIGAALAVRRFSKRPN